MRENFTYGSLWRGMETEHAPPRHPSTRPIGYVDPNGFTGEELAIAISAVNPEAALIVGLGIMVGKPIVEEVIKDIMQASENKNENSGERSFREKLKDIQENPEDWQKTGESEVPSTNIHNPGGKSIEEEYTNESTGEKIYKHTLKDKNGKNVEEPHYRNYPKQLNGGCGN